MTALACSRCGLDSERVRHGGGVCGGCAVEIRGDKSDAELIEASSLGPPRRSKRLCTLDHDHGLAAFSLARVALHSINTAGNAHVFLSKALAVEVIAWRTELHDALAAVTNRDGLSLIELVKRDDFRTMCFICYRPIWTDGTFIDRGAGYLAHPHCTHGGES